MDEYESEFEIERFPKDDFEKVQVKEVPIGFHTLRWTDKEFSEWEQEHGPVAD